jgi:hypothetical protein
LELLAKIGGALVTASCIAVVVVRAASAPAPPPLREPTAAERTSFALRIASQDADWRAKSADSFPADNWSQRDAFHNHEASAVRDLARGAGVSYESVFRAVDEDILHRPGRERSADAVPCKPRPFYD